MLFLHTSDLHLSEERPRTIRALEELLKTGEEYDIDILTIGGDLFHSEEDADILRPRLRESFSGNSFEILAIPGNHDRDAYKRNLDFGPDLNVGTREPFEKFVFDDVTIVGVPFVDTLTDELHTLLRSVAEESDTSVILLHCTLDIGYTTDDMGGEEITTYFPVSLSTLSHMRFDYVLAGHFHTDFILRDLEEGGKFVYPGSPVSHSWKEKGRRRAALIDLDEGTLEGIPLGTFYRDKFEGKVRPGEEDELIEKLSEWAGERSGEDCELKIAPTGHIKIDENEFGEFLEQACGGAEIVRGGYRNVEQVLSHPLFRRFKERLEPREDVDDKEAVEVKVIEAMSRLISRRELRL